MKPITSRRAFTVRLAPGPLWQHMGSVQEFQTWWPWLRDFSGGPPVTGALWHCTVRPPLLYRVRFDVHLDEVTAERRIAATVMGDVAGTALVELTPVAIGTEVAVSSTLEPRSPMLRSVAIMAPPLARRGHDWVLTRAALDFPDYVVEPAKAASASRAGAASSARQIKRSGR